MKKMAIGFKLAGCLCGALLAVTLAFGGRTALAEGGFSQPIAVKEIDLIHFSHTDVGFTDHPSVSRELFRRYVDVAVDTIWESMQGPPEKRFYWTAESAMPVADWWQSATEERRRIFLKAVASGQLELAALPFNNTPFMNARQWRTMTHWLPDEVWSQARPRVAIQNDVNGTPRAAGMALLDRGVRYLFTGINEDSGGSPFPRPSAFWWKMPDGRRLFVWLNLGYGSGFDFFGGSDWRRGPVPSAADTRYRPPRHGELLGSDEASVRASHKQCLDRIREMEKQGYKQEILAVSVTSQWRIDNDPPFAPIADFVAAWNKLGLEPRLRMTTAGDAMERMEKAMGATAPEYSGEWTDWWANGTASAPREVAASRAAKRFLDAVASPLWGPVTESCDSTMTELYRDLCLFDEHTWGSSLSVAKPYSLDTQGQFNEKSGLAFRPMARAEWLLAQRARTILANKGEGLYLANPTRGAYSGWARMIATCLRDNYQSVEDARTGARMKLYFEPGIQPWGRPQKPEDLSREDISATFPDNAPNQSAKFWVERIDAGDMLSCRLSTSPVETDKVENTSKPEIKTDKQGWPVTAVWAGMKKSLFMEGFGDLTAVKVKGFAPRHILADIRGLRGEALEKSRRANLEEVPAQEAEKTVVQENPHTILYTQALRHPRLQWAVRVLEVWKREPRARLTLRLNRFSSAAPEILYLAFPLPTDDVLPKLSNGGETFTPFTDQLPGTCRDYFAIDGWADYHTSDGRWLWVSRDAPLIAFGASPTLALRNAPPKDAHRLMAMLFNNFWYTNFVADEHGIMEFQFDLVWRDKIEGSAADIAGVLESEPVMLINPGMNEDTRIMERLYRP